MLLPYGAVTAAVREASRAAWPPRSPFGALPHSSPLTGSPLRERGR